MKRVCNNPIQIDALTVCFSVTNPTHYDRLKKLEIGESYSPYEFILRRIDGRYYHNIFSIIITEEDGNQHEFGQLKFGLNSGKEETHLDGSIKVWISLSNETLYVYRRFYFDYIASSLGLELHNITTLDLAIDTPFNVSKTVWKYIRDRNILTILNGRRIYNRDEDRPEISRTISGTLNKDKYLTLNVKQRNAMRDKTRGVTLALYDKVAEIRNGSRKEYILEHYNNPKRLYRTEVHLNNAEISQYLSANKIELTYWLFQDEAALSSIFFHFIGSVLRFQNRAKDVSWAHLLGRT